MPSRPMVVDQVTQPAFRASHPLDFSLYDSKDQHYVMYITNDPKEEHSLTLELRNTSALPLSFPDLGDRASNETNHFALLFRANTLSPKTIELLGAADKATVLTEPGDWDVALDRQRETVTLWFLYRGSNRVFASGERRMVGLKQISAAAGRGARGTKVELKPRRMSYADDMPITGSRNQHLHITSHRGSQQMPVHVGFIGSNRVLNDGKSEVTLTLQVMNTANPAAEHLASPTIRLKAGISMFTLTFDVADEAGEPAWALCKQSEFDVRASDMGSKVEWKDDSAGQGKLKRLTWSPDGDVTLEPGQAIEFSFSGFKSSLPAGQTNLYLHYRNIPGYWDGQFVCAIEKAPVLFASGNVGVGTAAPKAKLHVAGSVKIDGTNTLEFGAGIDGKQSDAGKIGYGVLDKEALEIVGAGKTGSDRRINLHAEGGLAIRGGVAIGVKYAGGETAPASGLLVEGNVGVGTTRPGARLHVAGSVKIDGANTLEFGAGIGGKHVNAGKIGYGAWDKAALGIFGAGMTDADRTITLYAEGGVAIRGGVAIGLSYADELTAPASGLLVEGNVGFGTAAPKARLHVAGSVKIDGTNTMEFGAGIDGKQRDAGAIGYGVLDKEALEIFGAGTTDSDRRIKLYAEGGLTIIGAVNATKFVGEGAFVKGMIVMWSGTPDEIPGGWALCDGRGTTPNLINRFVMASAQNYSTSKESRTGGGTSHSHSVSTDTGGSMSLNPHAGYTRVDSANHLPPYYKLAFIMKL
jgi:uncharacterized protein YaiE (UPF0345 family)